MKPYYAELPRRLHEATGLPVEETPDGWIVLDVSPTLEVMVGYEAPTYDLGLRDPSDEEDMGLRLQMNLGSDDRLAEIVATVQDFLGRMTPDECPDCGHDLGECPGCGRPVL